MEHTINVRERETFYVGDAELRVEDVSGNRVSISVRSAMPLIVRRKAIRPRLPVDSPPPSGQN